jgi:hypothetical protein
MIAREIDRVALAERRHVTIPLAKIILSMMDASAG